MDTVKTECHRRYMDDAFINELKNILQKNIDKRIVVVGTTCAGKTTLLDRIGNCSDMDKLIFPKLSKEEREYVCQVPWTEEIGEFMDRLVKERIKTEAGNPVFGTVVLDSDLIIYLDIDDNLLMERTQKRKVSFEDAKRMDDGIRQEIETSKVPCIKIKVRSF